jgi:hypothetical protein
VTRTVSSFDFDVSGVRILCSEKAGNGSRNIYGATAKCPAEAPHIGDGLIIHYTVRDTLLNSIFAKYIEKQPAPSFSEASGSAVIDAMPIEENTNEKPAGLTVRADGYRIRITADTKIQWGSPLQSLAEVRPGNWIKYKGKIDAAGVLVATSVEISPNEIDDEEKKLRTKNEYDPSAVPANARQNYLKNAVRMDGFDPKKIPPFKDVVMQARIEKIGNALIPAYQRALTASSPDKIDFRFQLIDTKFYRETLALPSGVILVPYQVVERMQNDSQLAAVLADGIARVLERQEYRMEGRSKEDYAWILFGAIVPFARGASNVGGFDLMDIQIYTMKQRSRVSLSLLHDAGYDIAQAPIAWWLLAPWEPAPISEIEVPSRVAYIYNFLAAIRKDSTLPIPVAH